MPVKSVEIYTTPFCGFCLAAKRLLAQKGVSFSEIDVTASPTGRQQMTQRAKGGRTVPQIFVGQTHIGGFTELNALERSGKLDPLLAA